MKSRGYCWSCSYLVTAPWPHAAMHAANQPAATACHAFTRLRRRLRIAGCLGSPGRTGARRGTGCAAAHPEAVTGKKLCM